MKWNAGHNRQRELFDDDAEPCELPEAEEPTCELADDCEEEATARAFHGDRWKLVCREHASGLHEWGMEVRSIDREEA